MSTFRSKLVGFVSLSLGVFWLIYSLFIWPRAAHAEGWIAPSEAVALRSPIESSDATMVAGKAIYLKRCVGCHGDAGKGDGPDASDLSIAPKDLSEPSVAAQTEGALFWKIQTGRKPMPKFGNRLSDAEIWSVVKYFRSFSK